MSHVEATSPDVSIVTVFYNRLEGVADSIRSLLDQTHPSFEIVVVDDGSTDGTREALQAIEDPRLRVITQDNSGFTVTINRAIRASRGRYVAIHGAGDVSRPTRLERQTEILDSRPEVGVVGCHVENEKNFSSGSTILASQNGLRFFDTLLDRNVFTHGEVMFRRRLFDRVGGYREGLVFAQDRDLWLRISRHADYAIVPEPLYLRRKFDGGVSRDARKLYLQAFFSDLAVENARLGVATGRDLFQRYGNGAALMKPPSEKLATRLAWLGARFMASGREEEGWFLIRRAVAEHLNPGIARIYALCALHRFPRLWRHIAQPLVKLRLARTTSAAW